MRLNACRRYAAILALVALIGASFLELHSLLTAAFAIPFPVIFGFGSGPGMYGIMSGSWSSIPKSVRGFYVWSPVAGYGDYNPSTPFTATNCDNDGFGFNQMTSDMKANAVTKAYLMPGTAACGITPSVGTSGFQLQSGFKYNFEVWGDPGTTPGGSATTTLTVSSAFGGGSPGSYDVLGWVGTTGTPRLQIHNLCVYDGGFAVRHVANLANPSGAASETSEKYLLADCSFFGTAAVGWSTTSPVGIGGALVMDYNEDSKIDHCLIEGNTTVGNGFSQLVAKGGSTWTRTSMSQGVIHIAAITYSFENQCVLPPGGIVEVDSTNTANYASGTLVGCPSIRIADLWNAGANFTSPVITNEMGASAGTPAPIGVWISGGHVSLGTQKLIGTPNGGGPCVLVVGGGAGIVGSSGAAIGAAADGTLVFHDGSCFFNNNTLGVVAEGLYPEAGSTLFRMSPSNADSPTGLTDAAANTFYQVGMGALGVPVSFKPQVNGRVYIVLFGMMNNAVAGVTSSIKISYGTGSAPAKNAAATGTAAGNTATVVGTTPTYFCCVAGPITGLTDNTAYWGDAQQSSSTLGDVTELSGLQVMVVECYK